MAIHIFVVSFILLSALIPLVHLIAPPGTPQVTGFPSGPVYLNRLIKIKCVASPPGDIYDWYKDGTKVTTSLTYDFYVKMASDGVYKCVARNDVGSATSSDKTLVVYYSVTELKMVEKPSAPMLAGVGVSIKCETDSSKTGFPGTISWYRNGQQIISGVTPSTRQASYRGIIYISQLTFTARKEDNQDKYECKINDQASFRKDVTITVYSEIPPIVNLKVTETGQTTATVTWDRVTSVPVTNYELVIVGTGPPKTVNATEVTPYVTVKGITPGRQYVLSVRAVIDKNKGPKASEKLFIVPLLTGDIELREQNEVTYEVTSSNGVIGQYEHYEDIPDILMPYKTD